MKTGDAPQVGMMDKECFPTMLPVVDYKVELLNPMAHYLVALDDGERNAGGNTGPVVQGFAGIWLMAGEAHLINIAVKKEYRRHGIGELLLIGIIQVAQRLRATMITLEVRVSNTAARRLYEKYGFSERGSRRGYYTDNREDAFIMTLDHPDSVANENLFSNQRKAYESQWHRDTIIASETADKS